MSLPSPLSPTSLVAARSRGWSRAGLSVLVGAVAALSLVLAGPAGPAAAHSELVGSTPATGAHVNEPPKQVRFTFSQDVSPRFASAALSVDGQTNRKLASRVEGRGLVADIPADLPGRSSSGAWEVAYRVVSADGHPISGTVSFTVAAPATGPAPTATARQGGATPPATTPTATPTSTATSTATTPLPAPAAAAGNAQPTSETSFATLLWLSLGAFVLVLAVGAAVWRSQDKSTPGPGTSGRRPPA